MSIIQASRSSELAALDLQYRSYKPERVTFSIEKLTKKRPTGPLPKELIFASFEDKDLCVVRYLRQYEARMVMFRQPQKENPAAADFLLLLYVKTT